ncbi:MAG TPA: hypothetical protein VEC56_01335 [Candidatus Krumholzibacteria bacterium]|nr:hypothetical protein [Candidatus Krumholzibacteria bacterium]
MDRRASTATYLCALAAVCLAGDASAFWPVTSRARLELRLTADEASAPWSWDAQSRSPLDDSRFMVDVTAGDARVGTLYAKGAASWNDDADAGGRVTFALEQGDYLFRWNRAEVRAFGDERRFFTYDLGAALMDDDVVDDYQHRIGVRADGGTQRIGGTLLVSSLDQGSDTQLVSYAKLRTGWRPLAAALSYRVQDDDATDLAIAKGEVAGFWKRATVVASYEQSGVGSGVFVPDGDWDSFGSGYAAAAPENSATFVEARLARSRIGSSAVLSGVYRYALAGAAYANGLASLPAGTELHRLGLYLSHRRYALDGRLVLFDADHAYDERGVAASARAFLKDNSEMNLRAKIVDATRDDGEERTTGSAHAIYRRSLQRFMGGIDALVDDIGADAVTAVGVETRINWSATSALYLRWIASGAVERSDAVYARLEFRPTARTWVTFAYGRAVAGDGPYLLEDDDALPTAGTEDVFTIVVRGDF